MVVGVILAGGYGKRLHPLTEETPKPLLEIKNNFTILDKQLLDLKYSGIKEVYLLVGYMWEKIKKRYGDVWNNLAIHYLVEEKPMGTLWALNNCFKRLNDDSVVLNGDIVTDLNIKELILKGEKSDYPLTIAITKMKSPYGIVEFKDSIVISFREKPILDYYINGGLYFIKENCYHYFDVDYPEKDVEKTVFPYLADMRKIQIYKEDGVFWQSIDSIKHLELVRKEFENREYKPWGYEKIVVLTDKYLVKELYIKKGYSTSLHYHSQKDETMHVQQGTGFIEIEGDKTPVKVDSVFHVEPNKKHRIIATTNLLLYEYSTPHPFDTIRIEDPYGRSR